ncbi:AAA domain-containing protein, partial [Frankia nepalensis]|uniref:AAA domain-containing protein n=1 Tax=Frankia nepalensis TaxID=1836974 RepID=UPI001EE3A648
GAGGVGPAGGGAPPAHPPRPRGAGRAHPAPPPPEVRLARLTEARDALAVVATVVAARDRIRAVLMAAARDRDNPVGAYGDTEIVDLGSAAALRDLSGAVARAGGGGAPPPARADRAGGGPPGRPAAGAPAGSGTGFPPDRRPGRPAIWEADGPARPAVPAGSGVSARSAAGFLPDPRSGSGRSASWEIHQRVREPGAPAAELRRVAGALATRDLAGYRTARLALLDALAARQASARRAELLDRLTRAHPGLADLLVAAAGLAEPDHDGWRRRLDRFDEAWAWALAAGWLADADAARRAADGTTGGLEVGGLQVGGLGVGDLDTQLDAAEDAVGAATAELAGAKAWRHCLERMGTRESAALRAYADAVAAGGRLAGRHAERYRQAAREAMALAQTAVPAWVMPIAEVLATIPAVRDSFDVVIVDEGSQAGLDSLFLLWLAPRVIIVGDDRQCTPPVALPVTSAKPAADLPAGLPDRLRPPGGDLGSGRGAGAGGLGADGEDDALDQVFRRLDALLPDLPGWLRVSFTPRSSLFSLLRTRFGEVIRLREHFRCMPEIIEWSSAMFYRDAPLVPLRQFGADRLPPLRARYVPHAHTTGVAGALRNPAEAEALVSHVLASAADPRHDGASFGVVVLQGGGQAELIRSLLAARMSAAEQQRRRLRVGTPPDFQGDERDVVFLSMVVAPGTPTMALTRQEYQRRFNVAASRARDQVWLFHSVNLDDLDPGDLRHNYLSYVLSRGHAGRSDADQPPRLDEVAPDIPHPRFDSLFEQRVFRELVRAGYRVAPQVEVNGRRIDLVVAGGRARLAVECDGDEVGTPEQVAHDFARERQLRRAGWPFWRIRQSDFESDPASALAGLWPRLAAAGIAPSGPPRAATTPGVGGPAA